MTTPMSLAQPARIAAISFATAIVGALLLEITAPPALGQATYGSRVICPVDGKPFVTPKVSAPIVTGVRLDGKPLGRVVAPVPLPVCPDNGFVVYKRSFSEEEVTKLRNIVFDERYQAERRINTDYYMAAFLQEQMDASPFELGKLYLQASWEAEAAGPKRRLDSYRRLAVQRFDTFLAAADAHTQDFWLASTTSADLRRMLGDFDAVKRQIRALPLEMLSSIHTEAVLRKMIEQICYHARNHNAAPERLISGWPEEAQR